MSKTKKHALQPLRVFQVVLLRRIGEGFQSPRQMLSQLHKRGISHAQSIENIGYALIAMEAKGYVKSHTGMWWELTPEGQIAYDKIVARDHRVAKSEQQSVNAA